MALRIFDTDPDAKPKPRFSDDAVGRLHSGKAVDGVPLALSEWRFSTGDPEVADAVRQLFGGTVEELETDKENFISVETTSPTILVVLDGPKAVYADMKLWNRNKLVHHCDGVEFLSPDEKKGVPCGCPSLFAERKQAAKDYVGPAPSISVTFRLADDYELGKFRFQTGSWSMAEVLHEYDAALSRFDGEVLAELTIEEVSYTTKKGRNVNYFKPVIKVLKSYSDAVAEAPF
ncbi:MULTISPECIES: hypothetical protein [unclassified Kitasatospora]|uniref:recombination directionality factor n=1 Tax=unclassified Kitasatospora TaxID=2633591 RepID=UPI0024772D0A|nr:MULTISPECIES: hypothetical protein [unclassified Kitasatospora]MDH6123844.1 hypothetical protein [Kitasatospora sp. GP82]MDH6576057.1 hypothetical protein [Kitasatospora sp. MAP5-34]